jgi:autotransporter-associated beta strand protein
MKTSSSLRLPWVGVLILFAILLAPKPARADSATWNLNPISNDWNTATNWTPNTVPNGPEDVATFDLTAMTIPVIHSDIELDTLFFTENALPQMTITVGDASSEAVVSLTLSGAGIVNDTDYFQLYPQVVQAAPTLATNGARNTIYLKNNAGITQGDGLTFTQLIAQGGTSPGLVGGQVQLLDNSTAGEPGLTPGVIAQPGVNGGEGGAVWFFDNSSAASADVVSGAGDDVGSNPGTTYFMGHSTATNAYLDNPPTQAPDTEGGKTFFLESSTAGDSIIYAGGGAYGDGAAGGTVIFSDTASAGNSVLAGYGGLSGGLDGSFQFLSDSAGGTAQVELTRTGNLIISDHNPPGITIGSLSDGSTGGGGIVILGSNNLTVGSNDLSTTFSGVIQDDNLGGSLSKVGTGNLTLTGANTYSGGTTVEAGALLINNAAGSGTGTGRVQVNGGILGGNGIIGGAVVVGTGEGSGAVIGPGRNTAVAGTFTIQKNVTLKPDATYWVTLNSNAPAADKLTARGVKIHGAQIVLRDRGTTMLAPGTVFTVINNTAQTPISGTFNNLPDGGTITVGSNTFQTSYTGGDGNDLTLTVVP